MVAMAMALLLGRHTVPSRPGGEAVSFQQHCVRPPKTGEMIGCTDPGNTSPNHHTPRCPGHRP